MSKTVKKWYKNYKLFINNKKKLLIWQFRYITKTDKQNKNFEILELDNLLKCLLKLNII